MESKNSTASTTFKNLAKSERKEKKPSQTSLTQNIENLLPPLEHFLKMTMSIDQFIRRLKEKYLLSREDMAMLKYPLRPEFQNSVGSKHHQLDATAMEFFPKSYSADSGNDGSGSSSEDINIESKVDEDSVPNMPLKLAPGTIKWKNVKSHSCSRCGKFFYTTQKKYITMEKCLYHHGKLQTINGPYGPLQYNCCNMPKSSPGCKTADLHVWAGPAEPVVNSSYVETEPPTFKRSDEDYGVYSLDCEMSYTVTGLQVVKVTLIDITGKPVYNQFIKPVSEVVDFNTRYSGVCKEDFEKYGTKSLVQVQRDLKRLICDETVLIGHGLENDLKGLKMLHKTVVDTSFVFPHFLGLPYRHSLRNLAQRCLKKCIQTGHNGHDSCEDARTCMDLMLLRLSKDFDSS